MNDRLTELNIAFIGAGAMAEAIIRGLVQQHKAQPQQIYAVNRSNHEQLKRLREQYQIQVSNDPMLTPSYIRQADIVVLAMKPKDVSQAFAEYRALLRPDQLLVSLVAGLSIQTMEKLLQNGMPIARTMPNTSSTIGLGATGLSFSASTKPLHHEIALAMFQSTGEVCVVDENHLDIVTGVSGSGPAYIYYMIESMIAAGVKGGLTAEMARKLTVQTVLGAASMVKSTNEDPSVLRQKVTSPNGTTHAAIETLNQFQFSEGVQSAVLRAAERAREIGETISAEAFKTL